MSDLVQKIRDDLEQAGNGGRALDAVDAVLSHCARRSHLSFAGRSALVVEVDGLIAAIAAALGVREDPED